MSSALDAQLDDVLLRFGLAEGAPAVSALLAALLPGLLAALSAAPRPGDVMV